VSGKDPERRRHRMGEPRRGKPAWLTMASRTGKDYFELRKLFSESSLNTICEEAKCPNIGECWNARTATFLILGHACTRKCTFCDVGYAWTGQVDRDEPRRLVDAVSRIGLDHVVITSVDRDDLDDGGAAQFVDCVTRLRARSSETRIELLIPDFRDKPGALESILEVAPDVLAHNLETVPALYRGVRPRSDYRGSLEVLRRIAAYRPRPVVKTGIMVGLGESLQEVHGLLEDVATAGVDVLTIGQYLQPSARHHRVERFWEPGEFDALAEHGRSLGIPWVEAGPFVRSSYHAADQARALEPAPRSAPGAPALPGPSSVA
jgi:lipoic acid synthetase